MKKAAVVMMVAFVAFVVLAPAAMILGLVFVETLVLFTLAMLFLKA